MTRTPFYKKGGSEMLTERNKLSIFKLGAHLAFILLFAFCVVPFIYIISISFSDEKQISRHGYHLIPQKFTTFAYRFILENPKQLLSSFSVSITVTVLGTLLAVLFTAMLAYTMARKDFRGGKYVSYVVFFTLLFNGGLVPWYIVITQYLHLGNTLFALILPYVILPWHVLLMRGFLLQVPFSLIESAKMDGATELGIFFKIVLPISTPAVATIALFSAFIYWNDWWLAMLFTDGVKLVPLQLMLYQIMNNIEFLTTAMQAGNISVDTSKLPNESARMAMTVLATLPILIVFPFCQRYFVKGITTGALKE
jgi:putative aldouronate transport system permease protein